VARQPETLQFLNVVVLLPFTTSDLSAE